MNGSFSTNSNGISGPIVIIPCRIDRLPDGDTSVVDGVAVQPQGQGILFHRIAIADGDAVLSISIIRIFPADFVMTAQSQSIGPGHRIGIAEYRIIAALHGIIGPQYMCISCFRRGTPVPLLAVHTVAVADGCAFICASCIIDPQRSRVIAIGIVCMADSSTSVLGLIIFADGYAHIVGHAVFSDGHTVFLGIGLMADGYSRPAFCRHIAAHGHCIGGIDETVNSQKRRFDIIPSCISNILSVAVLDILRCCGDAPLFIQIIISIILLPR